MIKSVLDLAQLCADGGGKIYLFSLNVKSASKSITFRRVYLVFSVVLQEMEDVDRVLITRALVSGTVFFFLQ